MAGADLLDRFDRYPQAGRRRPRRPRRARARVVVWGAAAALAATAVVLVTRRNPLVPPPACTVVPTSAGEQTYTLSLQQAQNAAIIAAVGFEKGLPDHAVTVALAASLQESKLRDLPYGDRDSVGLFQQRPSQGWGTTTQLLDPLYAAAAFYDRLAQVPGWQTMAVTDAAQAVQHSAAPEAYAAWEGEARALAVALTGEDPAGLSCRFQHFGGAAPAAGALGQALTSERGSDLIGTVVTAKTGWATAAWVVAHAYNYHVGRVSFAGLTWQPGTGKWVQGGPAGPPQTVTVQAG